MTNQNIKKSWPLTLPPFYYNPLINLLEVAIYTKSIKPNRLKEIVIEELYHCLNNLKIAIFGWDSPAYTCDLNKNDEKVLTVIYENHYSALERIFKKEKRSFESLKKKFEDIYVAIRIVRRYIELLHGITSTDNYNITDDYFK